MTRLALVVGAVLLSVVAGLNLLKETRFARRMHEPVPQTLARYRAGAPGVVIIFQPEDCLGDGTIVRGWNALSATPALRLRGLVAGENGIAPAQKRVPAVTGLRMPLNSISAVDAALLAEKMGYTSTPFAVVLDSRGRVAGSFAASRDVPPHLLSSLVHGR